MATACTSCTVYLCWKMYPVLNHVCEIMEEALLMATAIKLPITYTSWNLNCILICISGNGASLICCLLNQLHKGLYYTHTEHLSHWNFMPLLYTPFRIQSNNTFPKQWASITYICNLPKSICYQSEITWQYIPTLGMLFLQFRTIHVIGMHYSGSCPW